MQNCLNPVFLYRAALKKCMPDILVKSFISRVGTRLIVKEQEIIIKAHVNIVAYGKASVLMYSAAKDVIGDDLFGKGLLITHQKDTSIKLDQKAEKILYASHPLITESSYLAGVEIKKFVENNHSDDLLLALVSGGGSAMVCLPVTGLKLSDKIEFISKVLHMGVPEREVNVLKKSLSQIKGGKLVDAASGHEIINLVLSDERNHQLSAISSGMTVCNNEIDPLYVMDHYDLWGIAKRNIRNVINKHGKKINIGCGKVTYDYIIGSREDLISEIRKCSKEFGFKTVNIIGNLHSCGPETAVQKLNKEFNRIYRLSPIGKHLVIATGEVQVKVEGVKGSLGGRNQHLVAMAMVKFNLPFEFCFLAIATDGVDYLEGVHGAYFDSNMTDRINKNRHFILEKIENTNTNAVHKKFGTLIEGCKTGTNLSDFFLFGFKKTSGS